MTFEATGVSVSYGKRTILHGVDFRAEAGQFTMIVGPNGSGKTTLLRALTGDLAFGGVVRINGRDLARLTPAAMAALRGVLQQDTALAFPFTVAEVVGLGLSASAHGLTSAGARSARISEALEAVDLAGFAGRLCQELSGGERQRVQLARVLCQIWEPLADGEPHWLVLDEPVSSLDIRHQLTIMEIARSYAQRGGGVIAVMHDLNLTAMYGDHVAFLSEGRIVASGHPGAVISNRLLNDVYGCALRINKAPPGGLFVLPQSAHPQ
ncbi:MAG: heme ABC transporter ATP-binding protein [Notoacmeibacter sp.]|nr:heme ABC transporter ATP-binding protein [Notoacmeibacter sp.]